MAESLRHHGNIIEQKSKDGKCVFVCVCVCVFETHKEHTLHM